MTSGSRENDLVELQDSGDSWKLESDATTEVGEKQSVTAENLVAGNMFSVYLKLQSKESVDIGMVGVWTRLGFCCGFSW